MRISVIVFIVSLLPAVSVAQTVVFLPVQYEMIWTGKEDKTRAQEVESKIGVAAEKKGWIAHRKETPQTTNEGVKDEPLKPCTDQACLKKIVEEEDADEAVFVSIKNNDDVEFTVKIVFATAEPISAIKAGTHDSIGNWIGEMVSEALPAVQKQVQGASPSLSTTSTANSTPAISPDDTKRKKRKTRARVISLALTAPLVLSWGVVEAVGYAKLRKLDDKAFTDRTQQERDKVKTLRLSSRVLFGVAAVGGVTTIAVFLATHFAGRSKRQKDNTLSILTQPSKTGGLLLLQGTF